MTQPPWSAVGDNATDDSAALSAALASPSCSSVVLPSPGLFLCRGLDLSTATAARELVIASGAALVLWRDRHTWGNASALLWQSQPGLTVSGFTISGGGMVFGGGYNWWPPANESNKHLHFRPHTLFAMNVSDFAMRDVTILDSPGCNIEVNGERLLFERIAITAAGDVCAQFAVAPNTGGFRLSGRDIVVQHSTVHSGDDCVPINPAPLDATASNDAAQWGVTENVLVSNVSCACGTNGPVIFSPGGTVRNVTFEHMAVRNTFQGLGVKVATNRGPGAQPYGGVVADVVFSDITIADPMHTAIYADVYHEDAPTPCALPSPLPANMSDWLEISNITVRDVVATVPDGQGAGCFLCAPGDRKCTGWRYTNVTVLRHDGRPAAPYTCAYFRNASVTGPPSIPEPCGTGPG